QRRLCNIDRRNPDGEKLRRDGIGAGCIQVAFNGLAGLVTGFVVEAHLVQSRVPSPESRVPSPESRVSCRNTDHWHLNFVPFRSDWLRYLMNPPRRRPVSVA